MDYLHISSNVAVSKKLFVDDEHAIFSDKIMKITEQGKQHPRMLCITNKAVYVLSAALALKRRIPFYLIGGITEDGQGQMVIHIPTEWDVRLLIMPKSTHPDSLREALTDTYSSVLDNKSLPIMIRSTNELGKNVRTKAMCKAGAVHVEKSESASTFHDAMRRGGHTPQQHHQQRRNSVGHDDTKGTDCEVCTKAFGMFRKSYVCTLCKVYVCGSCSDLDFFPGFDDKVRACIRCLTRKAPTNVVKGVASGVRSIAKGVLEGATGVVLDPLRGAHRDGLSGFVKGVQTGLTGVVVKPAKGIVDALESTAKGVINTPQYVAGLAISNVLHVDVPNGVNQGNSLLKLKEVLLRRRIVSLDEDLRFHVPNANKTTQMRAFLAGKDEGTRDCVIITTKYVLCMINNEVVTRVALDDIRNSLHQMLQLPNLDRLVLKTKTSSDSIEFQDREACAFFANTLRGLTAKLARAIPFTIKLDNDTIDEKSMPTEITHSTALHALQLEIEKSKIIELLASEILEYHHVNLSLHHPKRATNFVGLTSLLTDCVILTNFRLLAIDSGTTVAEVPRAEIRTVAGEAILLQWGWGQLLVTLLSGQVVKITMNEREICQFYCHVLKQGVADRLKSVFNQNIRCDSETRSFSFADNTSFYILSKFGGQSLVLDHQKLPAQHDAELVLAPISGAITQKWIQIDDENGEPCIVPLAWSTSRARDGTAVSITASWIKPQVWSEMDADKGFVRLKHSDLCLSIEGFCCGNLECEKSRVRAGVRVCMLPAVSVACGEDGKQTEASAIQKWSFPTDFEVFIEELVEPAVEGLQEWQQCKKETEEQKSHAIPPLYVKQFHAPFWGSWKLSVSEPVLPPGAMMFGHYLTTGDHPFENDVLAGFAALPVFHDPASYELIGVYHAKPNEGAKSPLYFWRPVPHHKDFVALGHVCTATNTPPKKDLVACVDKTYLEEILESDLQQFAVIENGEGGISLWTSNSLHTFFACRNTEGIHAPPKGPHYRFPRNEEDLRKVQQRLGRQGLEMLGEVNRYLIEVVMALEQGEAEDAKDPLWLRDCYNQIMEMIQSMQDVFQHEGFAHFEMDRERLATYLEVFKLTQLKLKRYIYLRLKTPFKTLEDCAWELHLATNLVEVLDPITWHEVISWDFPTRLTDNDTAKLAVRAEFAPTVLPTLLELLVERVGTRAKELMGGLVDHELGLEEAAPPDNVEDQELLSALSGYGLAAKLECEEEEDNEEKKSPTNVIAVGNKLINELVDVLCVAATRTEVKKEKLERIAAQLFWNKTYEAIKKLFRDHLSIPSLTVTQSISAMRCLRKLVHLSEIYKLSNSEALAWVGEQTETMGRIYVAATRLKLVGFVMRFNRTEESYPTREDSEGFLTTPGPEDLSETFNRIFDAHKENKLDITLLARIAQTEGMVLEFFLSLLKFKFRRVILLFPETSFSLAFNGSDDKENSKKDRFLLYHGGSVTLSWMIAQCNNVTRWCQYVGNIKTTLLKLFADVGRVDLFEGINNPLAAATEGFRELYDCYSEALSFVVVKYLKFTCTQIGSAVWLDKNKHSEVMDNVKEQLEMIKENVIDRIQNDTIRNELMILFARSLTSRYLFNLVTNAFKYPLVEVGRYLEPDYSLLLHVMSDDEEEKSVKMSVEAELHHILTVAGLFDIDVDFLTVHTDALNKRFQDDPLLSNDKLGAGVMNARSDLSKADRSKAISLFPTVKPKTRTRHGIIGENWRIKVLIEKAKLIQISTDKMKLKPPNAFCAVTLLGPKSETGVQISLGKSKTPVAKSSLEPVWDYLFTDASASILLVQDVSFEVFEAGHVTDKSLGVARVSVEEIYAAHAQSGNFIKPIEFALALKDKDAKEEKKENVSSLVVRLLFSNDPLLPKEQTSHSLTTSSLDDRASASNLSLSTPCLPPPPPPSHSENKPTTRKEELTAASHAASQKMKSTFANLLHKKS